MVVSLSKFARLIDSMLWLEKLEKLSLPKSVGTASSYDVAA